MIINQTVIRNFCVVLLAALLTYFFLVIHWKWVPIHRWNRAFADASMVLLAITMNQRTPDRRGRANVAVIPQELAGLTP